MAKFLDWGLNNETGEFGAFIERQPRAHVLQPDGTFVARPLEKTVTHFNEQQIAQRLEQAVNPDFKKVWSDTAGELPRAKAMWENKYDMTFPVASAKPGLEQDLKLTAKPAAMTV